MTATELGGGGAAYSTAISDHTSPAADENPGRGVVVTGAARGMGKAIAQRFAASGHVVIGVDRDADALAVGFNWLSIFELRETGEDAGAADGDTSDAEGSHIVTDLT